MGATRVAVVVLVFVVSLAALAASSALASGGPPTKTRRFFISFVWRTLRPLAQSRDAADAPLSYQIALIPSWSILHLGRCFMGGVALALLVPTREYN